MTSKKSTKRALLLSVLAVVLCLAMLMGSTFAWFTDSASTAVNTIQAGNLDVQLNYWNGTAYVDATNVHLFNDGALWEPGHTEVAYLQVKNAGTLALQYQLGATANSEQVGINKDGDQFKLSEHLVFSVIDGKNAAEGTYTRDTAQAAAGTTKGLGSKITTDTVLNPGDVKYMALVVYMPTDVGNEANYQTGSTPPYISLGVSLVATQAEVESDSFGTDYDKDARYPYEINGETVYLTAKENGLYQNADDPNDKANYVVDDTGLEYLADTINANGPDAAALAKSDVTLAANVTVTENWVPIAKSGPRYSGTFDGGGHTVVINAENRMNYGNGFFGNLVSGAEIKNVTFVNANVNNSLGADGQGTFGGNIYGVVAGYAYGNVTFDNVHVKDSRVKGYGKVGGILGMAADPDGTTTLKNCSVENTTIAGAYNCGAFIGLAQNKVELIDCTTNNVTWERDPNTEYITFENQPTLIEGVTLDGVYMPFKYGATTYIYAAWGDYYTDLYYGDQAATGEYTFADGLCHNK